MRTQFSVISQLSDCYPFSALDSPKPCWRAQGRILARNEGDDVTRTQGARDDLNLLRQYIRAWTRQDLYRGRKILGRWVGVL